MKYSRISKSPCYCITLCRAANALTEYYDERMQGLGITVKQYSLLSNLSMLGEASTSELAEYVNLERSTLTRNIGILESKGWLRDKAQPGQRAHSYVITEAGAGIVESAREAWRGAQQDIKALLGEDGEKPFMEALNKLQELRLDKTAS